MGGLPQRAPCMRFCPHVNYTMMRSAGRGAHWMARWSGCPRGEATSMGKGPFCPAIPPLLRSSDSSTANCRVAGARSLTNARERILEAAVHTMPFEIPFHYTP